MRNEGLGIKNLCLFIQDKIRNQRKSQTILVWLFRWFYLRISDEYSSFLTLYSSLALVVPMAFFSLYVSHEVFYSLLFCALADEQHIIILGYDVAV